MEASEAMVLRTQDGVLLGKRSVPAVNYRGIGSGCDEDAMRVVGLMPRWNPGNQGGIPVRVRFTLPVKFVLQN